MLQRLDETRRAALGAAQILRERGHTKGTLGLEHDGPVCIMGAINLAMFNTLYWHQFATLEASKRTVMTDALVKHIGLDPIRSFSSPSSALALVEWNNKYERTADEVIGALESYGLSA